jgi:hypothetical protein
VVKERSFIFGAKLVRNGDLSRLNKEKFKEEFFEVWPFFVNKRSFLLLKCGRVEV